MITHKTSAIIDGELVKIKDSTFPVTDAVYKCDPCGRIENLERKALRDPDHVACQVCGKRMRLVATVTKNLDLAPYADWLFPKAG